ncbi:MAG: CPBP family intramembrane metalloprotease [Anaerolineales bacterium]|nr:MAG: CPBP family intramembrane metalloprotease [Anaerolineales bacterium]
MSPRRKSKSRSRKSSRQHLDPYFAYLIFVGVGLGSLQVNPEVRLTLLWSTLLALSMIYAGRKPVAARYSLANLGRGAVVGLIISLPFLLAARSVLNASSARLFPMPSQAALFQALIFVSAPVEELYFRGVLQREQGLLSAAVLYGLAGTVFFLPIFRGFALILLAVVLGMGLLGFVYGYVCNQYGLGASIACHAMVNLVLLFLPPVLERLVQGLTVID